jgi:hypothetical protein
MLRHVDLRTDVSKELSAPFIRVTRIGELGRTLAVISNRRCCSLLVASVALTSALLPLHWTLRGWYSFTYCTHSRSYRAVRPWYIFSDLSGEETQPVHKETQNKMCNTETISCQGVAETARPFLLCINTFREIILLHIFIFIHVRYWLSTRSDIKVNSHFVMQTSSIVQDLRFSRRWLRRLPSSGMLRRLALEITDDSEERSASVIRQARIGELGTTLAATSKRRALFLRTQQSRRLHLFTWGRKQIQFPKRRVLVFKTRTIDKVQNSRKSEAEIVYK